MTPLFSTTGMVPPAERLGADDAAGVEVQLRLVMQHEFAAGDAGVQLGEDRELLGAADVAAGEITAYKVVRALGLIHRDVGAAQQPFEGLGVTGGARDADGAFGGQPQTVDEHRLAEPLGEVGSGTLHRIRVADVGQEHREFIPAEPDEQICLAGGEREALGDHAQQLVACGVTEGVVDLFEVVEVDQDEADVPAVDPGAIECFLTALEEQGAVGQAGEGVVPGLVPLRVGRLAESIGVVLDGGEHLRVHHRAARGRRERVDEMLLGLAEARQPDAQCPDAGGARPERSDHVD
jgi:hypothetical protein